MRRFIFVIGIITTMLIVFSMFFGFKPKFELKEHTEISSIVAPKLIDEKYLLEPIEPMDIKAEAALLMNAITGDILYDKNSDVSLPIASMSKIMSQLIVLEAIEQGEIKWDDVVPISDYAYTISHQPGYASVLLDADTHYTVEQLFHAMAIRSANGATIALAEYVAGSEQKFVQMMNEKAEQLQLHSASFVNSTGLTNSDFLGFHRVGSENDMNMMSAKDLAFLSQYVLLHYPEILQITKKHDIRFG